MLDGAVCFDGSQGVEPQSETVWRQADSTAPRIAFVNKMDKLARFLHEFRFDQRTPRRMTVIQLPIGADSTFSDR